MNDLTHKQAIQYIHLRMDEMLKENQRSLLDEHLRVCDSCRAYSREMESLPTQLSHEFRTQWDKHPGPSQKVFKNVSIHARRIPMANRFSSNLRMLAGIAVLVALAFVINFVISRLQSTATAPTQITATPNPVHTVSGPAIEDLLAFSSTQSGNSEIYIMRPDGSELTNLTNNPANDSNPLWSPDGQHIAFESDRDGSYQIYWMDADGSNVTQLTSNKADHYLNINLDNRMNSWSPDGSKILFLENSSDNNWNLYAIGIDGRNQTLLASGNHYFMNVSWSGDGKHVAYVLDDSPNPNITFWPNIYVVDADGKNTKELKALLPQNEKLDLPYYWSPDDESIMFVANQDDQKHQNLYELNLLTGALLQKETLKSRVVDWQDNMKLILDTDKSVPGFIWQRSDGTSNTQEWNLKNCLLDFTKSSHGNLALGSFCNDTNRFQLYWANTDGSAGKQLYESAAFNDTREMGKITWSPDDRYITFMLASDVQTRFYILNVQDAMKNPSTQSREIAIGADQIHAIPAWRPIP